MVSSRDRLHCLLIFVNPLLRSLVRPQYILVDSVSFESMSLLYLANKKEIDSIETIHFFVCDW